MSLATILFVDHVFVCFLLHGVNIPVLSIVQTYAHKLLTGRRALMHTLKQKNGVSGFTSRFESEYDAFASGHGCNSVSAGLGITSITMNTIICMSFIRFIYKKKT